MLGLGVLSVIYGVGHWTVAPGLLWFRSATWGDGLLLPLAGGMLMHVARSLQRGENDWWVGLIGAVLGAAGGAVVIWQWKRDPAPALNWTLPRPHLLNLAGWYHALFLCACSSLITGLYFVVLVRLRRVHSAEPVRFGELAASPPWIISWAALMGFAGLVAVDSSRSINAATTASLYALSVAAIICFVPVLIIASGYRAVVIGSIVLSSLLAAAPISWAARRAPVGAGSALLIVVAIGCALAFAAADPAASLPESGRWTQLETLGALSIFIALGVVPTLGSHFSIVVGAACLAGVALALGLLKLVVAALRNRLGAGPPARSLRLLFHAMAPPWVMMVLAVTAVWSAQKPDINANVSSGILLLASVVVVNLLSPMLRNTYHNFVLAEEASTGIGEIADSQRRRGRLAAQAVTGIALAGVCSLLLLTAALAGSYGFRAGRSHNSVALAVLIASGVIVTLLALALLVSYGSERLSRKAFYLAALGACAWGSVCAVNVTLQGHGWLNFLLVILLGGWTAESLRWNCGILQREQSSWMQRLIAFLVGLSVASAMLWATTSGLQWRGVPVNVYWSLLPFCLVTLVAFLLIYVVAVTCFPKPTPGKGTNYGPIAGVLQDQGLMTLLALIVIWLPSIVFTHIPGSVKDRYYGIALTLLGFMLLFGSIYNWILRYNSRHAAFRRYLLNSIGPWPDRKRYPLVLRQTPQERTFLIYLIRDGDPPVTDREWVDSLGSYIAFQNLLSLAMVVIEVIPLLAFLKEVLYVPSPD